MKLIDRSPGTFFVVANGVLYLTVVVEIAMLLSGSYAAMVAVLVTIMIIGALLCAWVLSLMGSEAPDYQPSRAEARPREAAPARTPRPVTTGHPVAH